MHCGDTAPRRRVRSSLAKSRVMTPATTDYPAAPDARERAALLLALALVLVWGSNFTVQKAVFDAITPAGFLFVRYLVMPVCALALLWQRYGRRWPVLSRAEWWAIARLAFMGHVMHVGLVDVRHPLVLRLLELADPRARAGVHAAAAEIPRRRAPHARAGGGGGRGVRGGDGVSLRQAARRAVAGRRWAIWSCSLRRRSSRPTRWRPSRSSSGTGACS